MDLSEFLKNINPEQNIVVQSGKNRIYNGKVCDIPEDEVSLYWIVPESIIFCDDAMVIFVEHENEANRKLEEQSAIRFSEVSIGEISERITIVEAIIWAQEHHNQVMYLADKAYDWLQAECNLVEQYGFDKMQADAIMHMRNKDFSVKSRQECQTQLNELQEKYMILRGS